MPRLDAPMPSNQTELAAIIETEILHGMNDCLSAREIAARIAAVLLESPAYTNEGPVQRPPHAIRSWSR